MGIKPKRGVTSNAAASSHRVRHLRPSNTAKKINTPSPVDMAVYPPCSPSPKVNYSSHSKHYSLGAGITNNIVHCVGNSDNSATTSNTDTSINSNTSNSSTTTLNHSCITEQDIDGGDVTAEAPPESLLCSWSLPAPKRKPQRGIECEADFDKDLYDSE